MTIQLFRIAGALPFKNNFLNTYESDCFWLKFVIFYCRINLSRDFNNILFNQFVLLIVDG